VDKQTLRARVLSNRRRSLQATNAADQDLTSDAVVAGALANTLITAACEKGRYIASYQSFGTEPPTTDLNAELSRRGAKVLLPRYRNERGDRLAHMEWTGFDAVDPTAAAKPVKLADVDLAVVIIPALAVGNDLFRLGRGGGYYDRALEAVPRYPQGPWRIALVYATEVLERVPTESHDQPMDDYLAI
jgi:5-formyltetrahydrofolate cyclo-ligase